MALPQKKGAVLGYRMIDDRSQLPRKVLWRRMDVEGMDACCFDFFDDGYRLTGTALYRERDEPAKLEYAVLCNADWSSRSAKVTGWIGSTKREFNLSCDPDGRWSCDNETIQGVHGLLDIDLGFTPATNTIAIRRLHLDVGAEVETTAIWLDIQDWSFKPLPQVYRRVSETEFAYRSPSHNYSVHLEADDFGIILNYPELWTVVSEADGI